MSLDRYADDLSILLKFACFEWKESGCNTWADQNDIVKVSKAINTGSATSNVHPVNLDDRRTWFAKAWSIWGVKGTPDKFDDTVEVSTLVQTGKTVVKGGAGGILGNLALGDPVGMLSTGVALRQNGQALFAGVDLAAAWVPLVIVGGAVGAAYLWGRK